MDSLDKQLFRNYNELYDLILCCYKDISILKAYEGVKKEKSDIYNKYINISNHFVVLVQKDLAITIWKIYYDKNSSANTVRTFRNTISKVLREEGNSKYTELKQAKINKNIENNLRTMRCQFLAHADMTRKGSRIEISELKIALDSICEEFNRVCDAIDDDKISGVSEMEIALQDMSCYPELLLLYSDNSQQ